MGKVSILDVADMESRGEKIAMITTYDYTTA
jgi:ketopantoate hydroxymethyltransferase